MFPYEESNRTAACRRFPVWHPILFAPANVHISPASLFPSNMENQTISCYNKKTGTKRIARGITTGEGSRLGGRKGAGALRGRRMLYAYAAAGAQYKSACPGRWLGCGQCVGAGADKLRGRLCGGAGRLGARRAGQGRRSP